MLAYSYCSKHKIFDISIKIDIPLRIDKCTYFESDLTKQGFYILKTIREANDLENIRKDLL